MAFEAKAWHVVMNFKDRDNNTSTVAVNYDGATPFTTLETESAAIVAAIGALSDAPIVSYGIVRNFHDDEAPVPAETSDVERKGYFAFKLDDGRNTSISVPSIKNSLVIDNTNVINTGDPLVAAVVTAIQTSGTDAIGVTINRLIKAEKRHRNSSRG